QAMPCPDCYAPLGAQRARLRGAPEVVPGHVQLRPPQTEHLDGKGELEGAKAVISEDGDRSVPERAHWQSIYERWQNCQRRAPQEYPPEALFVVYCAGPHCNGADRAAIRLASLGRPVKKMIGGVTGWIDEGFPLTDGP